MHPGSDCPPRGEREAAIRDIPAAAGTCVVEPGAICNVVVHDDSAGEDALPSVTFGGSDVPMVDMLEC